MDGNKGEFASLDEIAGVYAQDPSARGMAETIRAVLVESTDLAVADLQAISVPVTLVPGRALLVGVTDVEGLEYEIFVQARR
jgi:hypothetical protein